jgi:hypothetical protein
LAVGDLIESVDDEYLASLSLDEIGQRLKDQTGSMITLHVHSEKRPVLSAGRFTMMMMPLFVLAECGGSSLHSGIEFGRSGTGEGSSGGRKRGVV